MLAARRKLATASSFGAAGLQQHATAGFQVGPQRHVAGTGNRARAQLALELREFEFGARTGLGPVALGGEVEVESARPVVEEQRGIECARLRVERPAQRLAELDIAFHGQGTGQLRELELLDAQPLARSVDSQRQRGMLFARAPLVPCRSSRSVAAPWSARAFPSSENSRPAQASGRRNSPQASSHGGGSRSIERQARVAGDRRRLRIEAQLQRRDFQQLLATREIQRVDEHAFLVDGQTTAQGQRVEIPVGIELERQRLECIAVHQRMRIEARHGHMRAPRSGRSPLRAASRRAWRRVSCSPADSSAASSSRLSCAPRAPSVPLHSRSPIRQRNPAFSSFSRGSGGATRADSVSCPSGLSSSSERATMSLPIQLAASSACAPRRARHRSAAARRAPGAARPPACRAALPRDRVMRRAGWQSVGVNSVSRRPSTCGALDVQAARQQGERARTPAPRRRWSGPCRRRNRDSEDCEMRSVPATVPRTSSTVRPAGSQRRDIASSERAPLSVYTAQAKHRRDQHQQCCQRRFRRCAPPSKVRPDVEVDLPGIGVDGFHRVGEIETQHAHRGFPAYTHAGADVQREVVAQERVAGVDEHRGTEAACASNVRARPCLRRGGRRRSHRPAALRLPISS